MPARVSLNTLRLGAIAIVLAVVPYKSFELDRFFIPKELVLHVTAALALALRVGAARRLELTRVDVLLASFLALGALSTAFADNGWLATRALAITASGIILFRVARDLATEGHGRALLVALATGIVIGSVTALLQAYGIENDFVSTARSPGGTFGNRNFMAHLAAIGTPIIMLGAIEARTSRGFALGAFGAACNAAALVLSRTRAAYLGLMLGGALFLVVAWPTRHLWFAPVRGRRVLMLVGAGALGIVAATALPNALDWKSDTPYLDSVRGVVNYREGSGRGRLVQYRNSLDMAIHHPLLGVGPGNWAVDYPRFASRNDPSLDADDGMTSNPWPSSDWVAFVSERGVVATACLVLAMLGVLVSARQKGVGGGGGGRAEPDPGRQLEAIALGMTVLIALVVTMFDAVLLLATPTFFVFAILGALMPAMTVRRSWGVAWRRLAAVVGVLVAGAAAARNVQQIRAMAFFDDGTVRALREAARLDPGSYRIQLRLAVAYARRGNCPGIREAAGAASRLFPNAPEPRRLLRNCGR